MKHMKKSVLAGICVLIVLAAVLAGVVIYRNTPGQKYQRQISLGNKYLSETNYDAAELAFRNAIRIDDKQTDGYLGVAKALRGSAENTEDTAEKLKKYDEAAEAFEQVSVIEPVLLEPYQELAATRIVQAQLIYPTDETAARAYYQQAEEAAKSASANGASDAAGAESISGKAESTPPVIVLPSFEEAVRQPGEHADSGQTASSAADPDSISSDAAVSEGGTAGAGSDAETSPKAEQKKQMTAAERARADRALQLTEQDVTVDLQWNLEDGTLTIPELSLSSSGWLALANADLLKTPSLFLADLGACGVNEYLLYACSPYILDGTVQHLVLTSASDNANTDITFALDEKGHLSEVQEAYTSDLADSDTHMRTVYTYDEQGRLTKLERTEDPLVFFGSIREMTFTYAEDGALTAYDVERYGGDPSSNGHYAVSYDADGRIGTVTHEMDLGTESGTETLSTAFVYEETGNLASVTVSDSAYPDPVSTLTFVYDEAGRLTGLETSDQRTAGVLWKSAQEEASSDTAAVSSPASSGTEEAAENAGTSVTDGAAAKHDGSTTQESTKTAGGTSTDASGSLTEPVPGAGTAQAG